MKKFLMYILCFICLSSVSYVSAEEIDIPSTGDNTNTGEITPGDTPEKPQEPTPEPEKPDVTDEPIVPETPKDDVKVEEVPKEESKVISPKNNTTVPSTTPKTGTYSYTTNKTTTIKKTVSVKISNIDLATEKLLSGAKLQIQDEDGNVLYEWESTDKEYIVDDLKEGKYYLVVISSTEDYEAKDKKIEFVVDYDKENIDLKIENNQVVKVPDTLSSSSILLLAIAMIDIAIGIWIIIYVKKNKVKE